jgi:prepilin-type N-terminal cleavage/methylation domain-containing protein
MDRQCGFTLMELIITVAIAAIVLGIGGAVVSGDDAE